MFTPTKLVVLLASALSVTAFLGNGYQHTPGLGACGILNNNNQDVASVSQEFFDTDHGFGPGNGEVNPLCNRTANVIYNDKTVSVQLTDVCDECDFSDISFSLHAFHQLVNVSEDHLTNVVWSLVY